MTEQEAIKFLTGYLDSVVYKEKCVEAHKLAIKALEENQQYLAIGAPEECRAAVEKLRKVEEVVKEWDKVGYAYSNNHMCEIKMIVKGGGVDE